VALQFPDEHLGDAVPVYCKLMSAVAIATREQGGTEAVEMYVLADELWQARPT